MSYASVPSRQTFTPPSTLVLTIISELVLSYSLCTAIAFYTNSIYPITHGRWHIIVGLIATVGMFTSGAAFLGEIIHSLRPHMNKSVLAMIVGAIWTAAAAMVTWIATRYGFTVWWWMALVWFVGAPLFALILVLLGQFRMLGWGFHGPYPIRSKV